MKQKLSPSEPLNQEVDPEAVDMLDLPATKNSLQRCWKKTLPALHIAMENLKTSQFFQDLPRPLQLVQLEQLTWCPSAKH